MMNIVNGGVHADNPIDIQEFMIMPVGAPHRGRGDPRWAPRSSTRCARSSHDAGLNTNVGDEGGFAPNLASADAALGFVMQAIEAAGYQPGRGCRAGARPGRDRVLPRRRATSDGRGQDARCRRHGRAIYARSGRALSDRLDRGRHGRGRLGRLGAADPRARATGSSSSATISSSPTRRGCARASSAASPTRC